MLKRLLSAAVKSKYIYLALAGIVLMITGGLLSNASPDSAASTAGTQSNLNLKEEDRLREMIEDIPGVEYANVLITYENEGMKVLEDETEIALNAPRIRGVAVVIYGDYTEQLELEIRLMIKAVLDIPYANIGIIW